MVKAFVNLDMNSNSISNTNTVTASTEIRANTGFSHDGTAGITSTIFVIDDSSVEHRLAFTNGILTSYTTKGGDH